LSAEDHENLRKSSLRLVDDSKLDSHKKKKPKKVKKVAPEHK